MKAISLLSGGKDSFLATLYAIEQGHEVALSISVKPREYSEMFHFPNVGFVPNISSLLDIPNVSVSEDDFYEKVPEIAKRYDARMIISGAIASNFQKTRIERMCTENNLISYTPLWLVDQIREVREVINSKIKAIICSVSAEGLDEGILGQPLDENMLAKLMLLHKKFELNISGEGGEYETMVVGWFDDFLNLTKHKTVWNGSSGYYLFDE
jgi:ABC transporter with metal-binding/Fe-S-binding domain ATP-binding protein